jgi:type I restriction enzyme R subunit
MAPFTESIVEDAALGWLEALGYAVLHGPAIAAGEPAAERSDPNYRDVVLEHRLRQALVRLNPDLSAEALEDAYRKVTRTDSPSLVERNRAVHRMLVDGVTVEYRRADGSIAGAQARVLDFDAPGNNDWLAVNQFTVAEGQHTRRPDVVVFVNGLPLAVVELKNPADENATVWSAFQQVERRRSSRRSGATRPCAPSHASWSPPSAPTSPSTGPCVRMSAPSSACW